MDKQSGSSSRSTLENQKEVIVRVLSGPVPMAAVYSLGKYLTLAMRKSVLVRGDMQKETVVTEEEKKLVDAFRPALTELMRDGRVRYLRFMYRRRGGQRLAFSEMFNDDVNRGAYIFLSERIDDVLKHINGSIRKPVPKGVGRLIRASLSENGLKPEEASQIGRAGNAGVSGRRRAEKPGLRARLGPLQRNDQEAGASITKDMYRSVAVLIPENRMHALDSGSIENYVIVAHGNGLSAQEMLTEIKAKPSMFGRLVRNFRTHTDRELEQALRQITFTVILRK